MYKATRSGNFCCSDQRTIVALNEGDEVVQDNRTIADWLALGIIEKVSVKEPVKENKAVEPTETKKRVTKKRTTKKA